MRTYRPTHIDLSQAAAYTHVMTRVNHDGTLTAIFADGHEAPSVFPTEAALLAAGRADWRERVSLDAPTTR